MRMKLQVTAYALIVLLIGGYLLVGNQTCSILPAKEVKVAVEEGKVAFTSTNGKSERILAAGEQIAIDDKLQIRDIATPKSIETPKAANPVLALALASLKLSVVDTEGIPFVPESVSIQDEKGAHILSIAGDGTGTNESLPVGNVEIVATDARLLGKSQKTTALSEGRNETTLIVARRSAFQAAIQSPQGEPVAGADVTLTPLKDAQKVTEADLAERKTNAQGTARFDPVVLGGYKLRVAAQQPYLAHEEIVQATSEPAPRSMALSKTSRIMVTVQDANSKPVSGAQVTLQSKPGSGSVISQSQATGANGSTVFEDIIPGTYILSANHPGFNDEGKGKSELAITDDRHEIALTVTSKAYQLSGKVYDAVSKQPVGGITVEVRKYEYSNDETLSEKEKIATTNSDGSYTVEGLEFGTYLVGVSRNDTYVHIAPFWFAYKDNMNPTKPKKISFNKDTAITGVDLSLYKKWIVSGRVLDKNGKPIQGVNVYTVEARHSADHLSSSSSSSSEGTVTDENGNYRYVGDSHVESQYCTIYLMGKHPAYKNTNLVELHPKQGQEITGMDLRFGNSASTVSGIVTRNGRPVEGAKVLFWDKKKKNKAITQSDGSYRAELLPGTYATRVICDGFQHKDGEQSLKVEEGNSYSDINFSIQEGDESFEGILVEEQGNPLAGIDMILSAHVTTPNSSSYFRIAEPVKTDEKGAFHLTINVIYEASDFCIIARVSDVDYEKTRYETQQWGEKDIRITAKKKANAELYGSIAGFAQDENGQIISHYTIQLNGSCSTPALQWEQRRPHQISDAQGAFRYDKIPVSAGPYLLTAKAEGSSLGFSELIILQADEMRENVVVTIPQSFSLRGRVIDRDGKPISEAKLEFKRNVAGLNWAEYRNLIPQTVTDADGYFQMDGVSLLGGDLGIWKPSKMKRVGAATDKSRIISMMGGRPDEDNMMIEGSSWGPGPEEEDEDVSGSSSTPDDSSEGATATASSVQTREETMSTDNLSSSETPSDGTDQGSQPLITTPFNATKIVPISIGAPGETRDLGEIVIEMAKQ